MQNLYRKKDVSRCRKLNLCRKFILLILVWARHHRPQLVKRVLFGGENTALMGTVTKISKISACLGRAEGVVTNTPTT